MRCCILSLIRTPSLLVVSSLVATFDGRSGGGLWACRPVAKSSLALGTGAGQTAAARCGNPQRRHGRPWQVNHNGFMLYFRHNIVAAEKKNTVASSSWCFFFQLERHERSNKTLYRVAAGPQTLVSKAGIIYFIALSTCNILGRRAILSLALGSFGSRK